MKFSMEFSMKLSMKFFVRFFAKSSCRVFWRILSRVSGLPAQRQGGEVVVQQPGDDPVVAEGGVPVAPEVVQAGIVVVPVADPAVAAPVALLDDAQGGVGERGGVPEVGGADHDERPGAVTGAQLVEETVVRALVRGDQLVLRRPAFAGVEGRG